MRPFVLVLLLLALVAAPASAFDPERERQNQAKGSERQRDYSGAEYQAELRRRGAENSAEAARIQATDPERNFTPNLCFHGMGPCAGDVRLYDFGSRGGVVRSTLWTARNGSTVSGHVWAARSGPARRPLIVITNGSLQAPEQLYWWAAQSLARAGYVVVTFDPQQQGRSDNYGDGLDRLEGVPAQREGNTFYDWTQDAIDFGLSTPARRFCARPSRSGTSHCAKQERRVRAGRNAAFNPLWELVDPSRIGIAGHSYGANGVSWVGQQDRRVDAVVAWDNLCAPTSVARDGDGPGKGPCLRGGQGDPPGFRVPSLGIAADYFSGTESRSSDPDPQERNVASRAFSRAGVDTGSIVIRGGTHFEFSYLPSPAFRATLRGINMAEWYTLAWFDRYVKGDAAVDGRLLSTRWRSDPGDRAVDPRGGGNLFSFYYRSRLDIRRAGGARFRCEDLRRGCAGQTGTGAGRGSSGAAGRPRLRLRVRYRGRTCAVRRTMRLTVVGRDARLVRRTVVRHRGRVVARGRRGATVKLRRLRRSGTLRVRATLRDGRGWTWKRRLKVCGKRR